MTKRTFVLGIILLMLIAAGCSLNKQIGPVDLSSVADGVYRGAYKSDGFQWEVKVRVKDHKIFGIEILKEREGDSHDEKARDMIGRVVVEQSLQVDAVSGATKSSKALLKAIENALSTRPPR
ncbi:FMN-binding protein [bacterium]|nr:FMN-binding protein [bacterium]